MAETTPFLDKLVPEIRLKIYEYLLIDEDLCDFQFFYNTLEDDRRLQYRLTPAILYTCRQVYVEASPVLYSNTFVFDCIGYFSYNIDWVHRSPLTRVHERLIDLYGRPGEVRTGANTHKDGYKRFRDIPSFTRIRRWKVLVANGLTSVSISEYCDPELGILSFCRAICHLPLDSLEICVRCMDCQEHDHNDSSSSSLALGAIALPSPATGMFLEHLKLLRNVKNLSFECYVCHCDQAGLIPEDERSSYKTLTESDAQIEHVFDKYDHLLIYAKTFERWEPFRKEMGLAPEPTLSPGLRPNHLNPYQYCGPHPVERHLSLARQASDNSDAGQFEEERQIILDLFEPQYKLISTLMDQLVEFVKAEKILGGIIGDNLSKDDNDFDRDLKISGQLLLEDLAVAFTRSEMHDLRVFMRKHRWIADTTYNTMERERHLKTLIELLDLDDPYQGHPNTLNVPRRQNRHEEWKKCFRIVGADMDKQWLDMRKARRALFDYDLTTDGKDACKIDIETSRHDEAIVWDVMEPTDIGPLQEGAIRMPCVTGWEEG